MNEDEGRLGVGRVEGRVEDGEAAENGMERIGLECYAKKNGS